MSNFRHWTVFLVLGNETAKHDMLRLLLKPSCWITRGKGSVAHLLLQRKRGKKNNSSRVYITTRVPVLHRCFDAVFFPTRLPARAKETRGDVEWNRKRVACTFAGQSGVGRAVEPQPMRRLSRKTTRWRLPRDQSWERRCVLRRCLFTAPIDDMLVLDGLS